MSLVTRLGLRKAAPVILNEGRNRLQNLKKAIGEAEASADGIYYCYPIPDGTWQLLPYRFDEFDECDHPAMWEEMVAPLLAHKFATKSKGSIQALEKALKEYPYGLPRGRVTKEGLKCKIFHGDNHAKLVSRSLVERAFSCQGKAVWEKDDHERAVTEEKQAVRRILRLKSDWPSVSQSDLFG